MAKINESEGQPKDLVQSVVRALNIIDIVGASREPLRAQAIATEANLHLATASHLLTTLVHVGYLERTGRSYRLAPGKILDLSAKVEQDLQPSPLALRHLQTVVERTRETAYLSSLHKGSVTITAVEEGDHAVRVADLRVGLSGNIHARASGKALLAFGPESHLERLQLADGELAQRTEFTIRTLDQLREDLEQTRARGYALDQQEYALGVGGMAVPLFEGAQWPRTALSITVPLHRFSDPENFQHYVDVMLEVRRLDAEVAQSGSGAA
jgi:DNA-binding IclR family transcriptional regulator